MRQSSRTVAATVDVAAWGLGPANASVPSDERKVTDKKPATMEAAARRDMNAACAGEVTWRCPAGNGARRAGSPDGGMVLGRHASGVCFIGYRDRFARASRSLRSGVASAGNASAGNSAAEQRSAL